MTDYKSQSRSMGRALLGLYGRSGDGKCVICEELEKTGGILEKTRLLQPLGFPDAPLLDNRNRMPQKGRGQNDKGIRRKACCMSKYMAEPSRPVLTLSRADADAKYGNMGGNTSDRIYNYTSSRRETLE